MYEILVDEENTAEEFWDAVADHGGGSFPINTLLNCGRVIVTAEERDQLLSHFRTMPGWAQFPKLCPCCKKTYSAEDWVQLRWDGTTDMGVPGSPDILEFRTCPCGSTLAIEVTLPTPQPKRSLTPPANGWRILSVRLPKEKV